MVMGLPLLVAKKPPLQQSDSVIIVTTVVVEKSVQLTLSNCYHMIPKWTLNSML